MSNAEQIITQGVAIGSPGRWRVGSGLIAHFIGRLRRPVKGGALLAGDAMVGVVALFAASLGAAYAAGASVPLFSYADLGLLLLILLGLGLYTGGSQCPYARFRLRCSGVAVFAVAQLFFVGSDGVDASFAAGLATTVIVLLAGGFYVEMLVRHILTRTGIWAAPAVIVGCDDAARRLYEQLSAQSDLGLRPLGFMRTSRDENIHLSRLPAPVGETIADFVSAGAEMPVAIVTSGDKIASLRADATRPLPGKLIVMSDADIPTLGVRVRSLGSAVGIQLERGTSFSQNRGLKRALDLIVAIPAAIIFAPLIGVLALLITLVDGGTPFYWQRRVGADGRSFSLPKLRSMYRDSAERLEQHLAGNPVAKREWERFFKLSNDPRILPYIGNFIRRSSIDELPQLWSVIVGDMSLVGPRPFPQYHIDSFDAEFQRVRTTMPPGLTGLWQVSSRSDGDLEVQQTQDTFYIRNWSIWLDLYILFKTLPVVLLGSGAK